MGSRAKSKYNRKKTADSESQQNIIHAVTEKFALHTHVRERIVDAVWLYKWPSVEYLFLMFLCFHNVLRAFALTYIHIAQYLNTCVCIPLTSSRRSAACSQC